MSRDSLTVAALVAGGVALGGGAAWVLTHRAAPSSTTSGATPSSSTPSGGTGAPSSGATSGNPQPGPSSPSSGSAVAGTPNASGGTVTLNAPSAISAGSVGTLMATASGMTSPVYQFWWQQPGQTTWTQSGHYSAIATAEVTASTTTGTMTAVVYARPASAPGNETDAQRTQYEAHSAPASIAIQ